MSTAPSSDIRITPALVTQLAELAGMQVEASSLERLAGTLDTQIRAIGRMPFGDPLDPGPEQGFEPRWDR